MTFRKTTRKNSLGYRRPVYEHFGHAPRIVQPDTTIRMLAMPTKTMAVGTSILNSTPTPVSLPSLSGGRRRTWPALVAVTLVLATFLSLVLTESF